MTTLFEDALDPQAGAEATTSTDDRPHLRRFAPRKSRSVPPTPAPTIAEPQAPDLVAAGIVPSPALVAADPVESPVQPAAEPVAAFSVELPPAESIAAPAGASLSSGLDPASHAAASTAAVLDEPAAAPAAPAPTRPRPARNRGRRAPAPAAAPDDASVAVPSGAVAPTDSTDRASLPALDSPAADSASGTGKASTPKPSRTRNRPRARTIPVQAEAAVDSYPLVPELVLEPAEAPATASPPWEMPPTETPAPPIAAEFAGLAPTAPVEADAPGEVATDQIVPALPAAKPARPSRNRKRPTSRGAAAPVAPVSEALIAPVAEVQSSSEPGMVLAAIAVPAPSAPEYLDLEQPVVDLAADAAAGRDPLEPVAVLDSLLALDEDLPDLLLPPVSYASEDPAVLSAEPQFDDEDDDDALAVLSPEAIDARALATEAAMAGLERGDPGGSAAADDAARRRSRRGRRGGRGRGRTGAPHQPVETSYTALSPATEPAPTAAPPAASAAPTPVEPPADLFAIEQPHPRDRQWRERSPRRQWGRTYSRDLAPVSMPPPKPSNGARLTPVPQAVPPLSLVAPLPEVAQFPAFTLPDLQLDALLAPGETRVERLLEAQTKLLQTMVEQQARQIDTLTTSVNHLRQSISQLGSAGRTPLPRTGIFVDAPNVCYAADNARVTLDFGRMLKYLSRDRHLVHAFSYAPITDDVRDGIRYETQRFVAPFLRTGYKLVTKPLKRFPDGSAKGNFDIELAIDIVTMSDRLDVVVLVSGDSDFERLIELIQSRGVRVEVVAFASNVSTELVNIADVFIDINQHIEHMRAL